MKLELLREKQKNIKQEFFHSLYFKLFLTSYKDRELQYFTNFQIRNTTPRDENDDSHAIFKCWEAV